ncbi:MAG: molybdopterin molybdotransferase MoeA [Planctomycetes bacterium]|nr:molybdopterin molybdotransferase MoeA [Planctomycetota bacterium]
MRGFAERASVDAAWAWIAENVLPLDAEWVDARSASGRVLAADVRSDVDVPLFDRAMMDGYAVRASDCEGASSYHRVPFEVIGEVLPGRSTPLIVTPGRAIRVMTGAPVPEGADAVLPFEKTERDGDRMLAIDELPPGKNIGRRGEDIAVDTRLFAAARRLRPQDVGVLASIGAGCVSVVRRPKVRIVVTGDELLPAGERPRGHQIVDANSPMLEALVTRDGGIPRQPGIVRDNRESILENMRDDADVILVSGGSSVGKEDHAPAILAQYGTLAIHGVAMRPSSPAGMGRLDHRFVFLLPGNPVSCLCAYDFFAGRAIRLLAGRGAAWPYRSVRAPLRRKLVSQVGRVDYARVRFEDGEVEPIAIAGAAVLSSTSRADGFVVVPADSEGYPESAIVEVHLYDEPCAGDCDRAAAP